MSTTTADNFKIAPMIKNSCMAERIWLFLTDPMHLKAGARDIKELLYYIVI